MDEPGEPGGAAAAPGGGHADDAAAGERETGPTFARRQIEPGDCDHCIERLKSELLVDISHEFRTPLTLVLGPLQDLENGVFGIVGRQKLRQIALARRNAQRVLDLVDQLLDAARLDAGAVELHAGRGDLADFLRLVVERFRPQAAHRGTDLCYAAPPAPVDLWFDPIQLDKVFSNLINNALKYTPGGGRVEVRLEAPAADGPEAVEVRVTDDGPGIAADRLPRVFDRFARDENQPYTSGTGLGLSLARSLAELHGGTLGARSVEGEGSTFIVRLPAGHDHLDAAQLVEQPATGRPVVAVAAAAAPPEPAAAAEAGPAAAAPDAPLVLVVDDHAAIRDYLRRHLAGRYRIEEAATGEEALERARELLPDLVVSDVLMPGMDGYQLCREIKRDPELDFVPVILLSAKAASESRVKGLREGADDYLTKPFDAAELAARADNLIASRRRLLERFGGGEAGRVPDGLPLAPRVHATAEDEAFLARTRQAIGDHLGDEGYRVDALADALAMDRSTLFRRLRELTGLTPSRLIFELRMDEAARLLRGGEAVSEVSWRVGFKDVSHFARRFRSRYRVKPSAFRAGRPAISAPARATGGWAANLQRIDRNPQHRDQRRRRGAS